MEVYRQKKKENNFKIYLTYLNIKAKNLYSIVNLVTSTKNAVLKILMTKCNKTFCWVILECVMTELNKRMSNNFFFPFGAR